VEGTDVGRAVAHLADHHLVPAALVDGERGTGGQRDLATDEPPQPLDVPVVRPYSSAITRPGAIPFAMA
jgi:hypothetical protein